MPGRPDPLRVLDVGALYLPHGFGGYEVLWRDTVNLRRAAGHEVRILCTAHRDPAAAGAPEEPDVHRELRWWSENHAFPRRSVPERLAIEATNARAIRRHVRDLRPHVATVWAMGGMSLSIPGRLLRAGLPVLSVCGDEWLGYAHHYDGWTRMWRARPMAGRAVEALTRQPTSFHPRKLHWLFISRYLADRCIAARDLDPAMVEVAHPGVDVRRFAFRGEAPPWRGRLLYAGRLAPTKGVTVAADAMAHLPAATLMLDGAGEPDVVADLEDRRARLGLGDRLVLTRSSTAQLPAAYADADVLLFPVTWNEPWGLVPLEAMSVGVPVVATGLGGSGEYLRDEENCLLVAPGDAVALAAAVQRLAGDAALRGRLVASGRQTAARFPIDAFPRAVAAATARLSDI